LSCPSRAWKVSLVCRTAADADFASPSPPPIALSSADSFHTHLNIFVDVLDKALHTPLFVRRTSAILFTTIVTIASRFRRPSLHTHLHKMVDNMLGRAFAEGVVEVGLIQSLSLLAFWKEADDRSTWRKVGYGASDATSEPLVLSVPGRQGD
jgi:hypothetical protein